MHPNGDRSGLIDGRAHSVSPGERAAAIVVLPGPARAEPSLEPGEVRDPSIPASPSPLWNGKPYPQRASGVQRFQGCTEPQGVKALRAAASLRYSRGTSFLSLDSLLPLRVLPRP